MRSAATRIALVGSAAFAVATILVGVVVYWAVDRAIRVQLDDRIATEMSSLVSEYRGEGVAGLRGVIAHREIARATNDLGYGLFAADGRRIAGALDTARPAPGMQTLLFYDPAEGYREPGRAQAVDIGNGLRLVVAADLEAVHRIDRLLLILLAAALGATVAIGTAGAVWLATYLRGRLAVIAGGAEAIMAGDLARRIALGRNGDEFDRLAGLLNQMLDRITALLENLRQVSGDIAHDLRMPLTRLRNRLEQGLEQGGSLLAIEQSIEQADQVLALFGSLLRLSEIEAGKLSDGFAPIDLGRLAADLADSYLPAIEDGGRSLRTEIAFDATIHGDRELLAQIIVNLLDNAQAHTPIGTTIRLSVETLPDRVALSVADDGPGVAARDHARIVARFARLEASRHVPGHGLGLSLVAAIAQVHGGRLRFGDNQPGLVAIVEVPR